MHIRILLCDDHQIVLDSLSLLISTMEKCEVVGALNDGRRVPGFLRENSVDILLVDVSMPYLTGVALMLQLRDEFPSVKVVILTVSDDQETIRQAFQAGVSGYVLKTASRNELENAIRTVARGERFCNDPVLGKLIAPSLAETLSPAVVQLLTSREIEVVRLIAQELTTPEIAEKLFLSTGTIETHRHNIIRKLGVKNSVGIIKYAILNKLV